MCLYIIHFLLAVNYDKKVVQTHFLLLFVNKKYPETYILLWKGGWFWLFTHFANKKPSASPRAFYCCKMCKKSKSPPFLYYKNQSSWSSALITKGFEKFWGLFKFKGMQRTFQEVFFKDVSNFLHDFFMCVSMVLWWCLKNISRMFHAFL